MMLDQTTDEGRAQDRDPGTHSAFYQAAHDAELISDDHSSITRSGVQCFTKEGEILVATFLKEEQRVAVVQLHPDGTPRKGTYCRLDGLRAFLDDIWSDSARGAA
jgi:hypothetical protein